MIDILNDIPDGYVLVSSIIDMIDISPDVEDYHTPLVGADLLLRNSDGKYEKYKFTKYTEEVNIIKYIESKALYMKKND